MTSDELEDAPQADGLLAYEREPIHLSLGVTIENLVKVCKIWSCLVFFAFANSFVKGRCSRLLIFASLHCEPLLEFWMAKVTALFPALLRGLDVNDLKKSPKINF